MRVLLIAVAMATLTQSVWANCDLSQPDGVCETTKNNWIRFATGEGRSLSEAYCFALGTLLPIESEQFSVTTNELSNGLVSEVGNSRAEMEICDLRVVAQTENEEMKTSDGTTRTSAFIKKITVYRGMSSLGCGYESTEDENSVTIKEFFDESKNFYTDLIHSANPPNCGPEEMFKILESEQMDDGSYWLVKVAHRFKGAAN